MEEGVFQRNTRTQLLLVDFDILEMLIYGLSPSNSRQQTWATSAFPIEDAVVIVKRLGHAIQVRCRGEDNADVEYLVRAPPDIEGAWRPPFRPTSLHSVLAMLTLNRTGEVVLTA